MSAPLLLNTPDGFTREALSAWVARKLGDLVWRVEGFDCAGTADQAIEDAAMMFSEKVPMIGYRSLQLGTTTWTLPPEAMGILHMFFVDGTKFFTQTAHDLNKSLLGVSSIQMAGGKVGEYVDFLMWRKTFQRILSQRPSYVYDEMSRKVVISNPAGYIPCVMYSAIRPFERVPVHHRTLVRDLALASATERLGIIRSKFGGQLPGPGGTTISLDGKDLIDRAREDIKTLKEKLESIKTRMPIMFD